MAGFTASWVHGNAVVMEQAPGGIGGSVLSFDHFGWGTQITMRPNSTSWFHIAIPTPVILDAKRMKLLRVFLQVRQIGGFPRSGKFPRAGGGTEDLHLYDAQNLVAKLSAKVDFNPTPDVMIEGNETFELRAPREWVFGVGLSFQLSAEGNVGGHFVDDNEAPVLVVGSAGADFGV
jgi:hypothetical protein